MGPDLLVIGTRRYSSWSLRGWLAVRLAGLDVPEQVVRLADGPSLEIGRLSPSGLVPYLEHDGNRVWDSLAIGEYCAELAPGLWPASRPRPHPRSGAVGGDACGVPGAAAGDADEPRTRPAARPGCRRRGAGRHRPHRAALDRHPRPAWRWRPLSVRRRLHRGRRDVRAGGGAAAVLPARRWGRWRRRIATRCGRIPWSSDGMRKRQRSRTRWRLDTLRGAWPERRMDVGTAGSRSCCRRARGSRPTRWAPSGCWCRGWRLRTT